MFVCTYLPNCDPSPSWQEQISSTYYIHQYITTYYPVLPAWYVPPTYLMASLGAAGDCWGQYNGWTGKHQVIDGRFLLSTSCAYFLWRFVRWRGSMDPLTHALWLSWLWHGYIGIDCSFLPPLHSIIIHHTVVPIVTSTGFRWVAHYNYNICTCP